MAHNSVDITAALQTMGQAYLGLKIMLLTGLEYGDAGASGLVSTLSASINQAQFNLEPFLE